MINFIFVFDEGLYIYDVIDPLNPQVVRRHYNCMPATFLIGKLQSYAIDRKGRAELQPGLPYLSRTSSAYVHDASDIVIRDNLAYVIMRCCPKMQAYKWRIVLSCFYGLKQGWKKS